MAARQKPGSRQTQSLYPQLQRGPRQGSAEDAARHQRMRLQGAMVEAVARNGYTGTSLNELVALAGVSKATFYEHYENKQDLFLDAFDTIIREAGRRVSVAYREPGDLRERLTRALSTFFEIVVDEPAAAQLAAVESLSLGAAGIARREAGSKAFETLIAQSFGDEEVSTLTVKAIVAGIRGVLYRRLRTGRADELAACVDPLVSWALGYGGPEPEPLARAMEAASQPRSDSAPKRPKGVPSWESDPTGKRAREKLTARERVVRGAARVVVAKGFENLSIPAISAAAGASNQTFYSNFSHKRDAVLEAFELLAAEARETTLAAANTESDPAARTGAGMRGMLEHIAANPTFAHLAFFDLQTAGPIALDRAEEVMDSFSAALPASVTPHGEPIGEAVAAGIWACIQHLLMKDPDDLPAQAPELVRLLVIPFPPA